MIFSAQQDQKSDEKNSIEKIFLIINDVQQKLLRENF